MPSIFIYLGIMLVIISVWFLILKRPAYEAILLSFLAILTVTGTWQNIGTSMNKAMSTSLLYSMTSFIAMSILLTKTKIIDGTISIVLALVGRIPGGAGYAAVLASAFMGALSGSGPGNVMATGSLTIPAMKKSGMPAELAANIESNASCLGNMIPPSSNIVAAYGSFCAVYPATDMTIGQFWLVLWGVSLWFILQRVVMVFAFCKRYQVKAMDPKEIPTLKEAVRKNWRGLLLPVIILFPFAMDYFLKDLFFMQRLGEMGAKYFSNSMLLIVPGLVSLFCMAIVKDKSRVSLKAQAAMFSAGIKSLVPSVFICLVGYAIGNIFSDMNAATELEGFILSMQFGKLEMVFFLCIITCLLGMVISGSSLVVILGPVFISALVSVGVDPLLAAVMLPCICGVMCNITPPLAAAMYAAMSLADADFGKTIKNDLWWVAGHFILEVIVLMGIVPIWGL